MKCILRDYGVRKNLAQRQADRSKASDMTVARGTGRIPGAVRDLFLQSAPRGVLVNWRIPTGIASDLAGFRIYSGDESSLYAEIRDPSATQHFVETTAGATPPTSNIFVSAINKLNIEGQKTQIQGAAIAETGAPTMPSTPPTFTTGFNNLNSKFFNNYKGL